jgi:hypothetical protein
LAAAAAVVLTLEAVVPQVDIVPLLVFQFQQVQLILLQ